MDSVLEYWKQIFEDEIIKVIFSGIQDKEGEYKKIVIQRKERGYQIERYTKKQVFHENIEADSLRSSCESFFAVGFGQMNAWSVTMEYSMKQSKKGKILFHKAQVKEPLVKIQPHNRKKEYLLEEGCIIPPLIDMGIFTKDGKVINSMYDKYKQINKFIEIVEDSIKKANLKRLHIIDFGCGKSYLTFIVYYYLKEIKNLEVKMTGLDLKEDVILKCRIAAEKYGYEGLHFEVGDIHGYQTAEPVDMVLSLHACDTATDFALYNAIQWKAKIILSVPCCQHELAKQMQGERFLILQKYGIVKERTAALMTDAIRCNLLTFCGYKTQLLEFVDLSHTPKNLLIRAVRTNLTLQHKQEALEEVKEVMETFHLKPTLMELLKDITDERGEKLI